MWFQHVLAGEKQSDEAADVIIERHNIENFDLVVSIGGGRAIDTGKIVAKKLPHIAVPTTARNGCTHEWCDFWRSRGP